MLTFERSIDTQTVIDTLRGVNDEISYGHLAQRCKLSTARVKQVLASARRSLRRENILFGVIFGQGLRRLGDLDKARKTENIKRKISRAAKREIKDLATIEHFEALPNIEQTMVSTNRVVLHVIAQQAMVKPELKQSAPSAQVPNVARLLSATKK